MSSVASPKLTPHVSDRDHTYGPSDAPGWPGRKRNGLSLVPGRGCVRDSTTIVEAQDLGANDNSPHGAGVARDRRGDHLEPTFYRPESLQPGFDLPAADTR